MEGLERGLVLAKQVLSQLEHVARTKGFNCEPVYGTSAEEPTCPSTMIISEAPVS